MNVDTTLHVLLLSNSLTNMGHTTLGNTTLGNTTLNVKPAMSMNAKLTLSIAHLVGMPFT